MSRWSKGFLGLLAASLMLGAAHLEIAAGNDLKTVTRGAVTRGDAGLTGSRGLALPRYRVADIVNREAKADRLARAVPATSGATIVFKVSGLSNTSVATFVAAPIRPAAGPASGAASRAIMKTAACEPPVSALAEAAQLLKTGRCIT